MIVMDGGPHLDSPAYGEVVQYLGQEAIAGGSTYASEGEPR